MVCILKNSFNYPIATPKTTLLVCFLLCSRCLWKSTLSQQCSAAEKAFFLSSHPPSATFHTALLFSSINRCRRPYAPSIEFYPISSRTLPGRPDCEQRRISHIVLCLTMLQSLSCSSHMKQDPNLFPISIADFYALDKRFKSDKFATYKNKSDFQNETGMHPAVNLSVENYRNTSVLYDTLSAASICSGTNATHLHIEYMPPNSLMEKDGESKKLQPLNEYGVSRDALNASETIFTMQHMRKVIGICVKEEKLDLAIDLLETYLRGNNRRCGYHLPLEAIRVSHVRALSQATNLATGVLNLSIRKGNFYYVFCIVNLFYKYSLMLQESSYSSLVSWYASHGYVNDAITVLRLMDKNEIFPKQRTYLPLLTALILRLSSFHFMNQTEASAAVEFKENIQLLQYLVKRLTKEKVPVGQNYWAHFFWSPIHLYTRLAATSASFSKNIALKQITSRFLYEILSSLMETANAALPSKLAEKLLRHNQCTSSTLLKTWVGRFSFAVNSTATKRQRLAHDTLPAPKKASQLFEPSDWLHTRLATETSATSPTPYGVERCPSCGARIYLSSLSTSDKRLLQLGILKLIAMKNPRDLPRLNEFVHFLSHFQRSKVGYTAILDAANIGYEGQNRESGHFSYVQIEMVLRELRQRGEKPLIILPRSYYYHNAYVPNRSKQPKAALRKHYFSKATTELKPFEIELMKQWEAQNSLFVCDHGSHDDYYYLYASVAQGAEEYDVSNGRIQLQNKGNLDLSLLNSSREKLENKAETILPATFVVTNDLLRDHHLATNEPLAFQRWKQTSLVTFHFSFGLPYEYRDRLMSLNDVNNYIETELREAPKLYLNFPERYAFPMQMANQNSELASEKLLSTHSTWHIPIRDYTETLESSLACSDNFINFSGDMAEGKLCEDVKYVKSVASHKRKKGVDNCSFICVQLADGRGRGSRGIDQNLSSA